MEKQPLLYNAEENLYYSMSINDPSFKIPMRPSFYVPQRLLMSILLFLLLGIVYFLRANLSVAIIAMSDQYNWDDTLQGILLSAFFWGYIWMQVPGGVLSRKFGGKIVLTVGIAGASIFSAALPLVADRFELLLMCRILTGLFEAVSYPTVHTIISEWLPDHERSRALGFIWSGSHAGTITSNLIAPMILKWYGWPSVFYFSAGLGMVWYLLWQLIGSDKPSTSRWISAYELYVIKKGLIHVKKEEPHEPIPWKKIFCSGPVWALIINAFCSNWGGYVLLTWLPTYMKKGLHFDLEKNAIFLVLPYLALLLMTIAAGRLADFLLIKGWSKRLIRHLFQGAGMLLPATFLGLLCAPISPMIALLFMTIGNGSKGFVVGGSGSNYLDIAPEHAGIVLGICNTAGTIPGIIGVSATGFILHQTGSWCFVFLLASSLFTLGALVWFTMGSVRRVV